MKHLTPNQYQSAHQKAVNLLQKRIGSKPTRAAYKREFGPLWSILDTFAVVIFVGALIVSSTHILSLMHDQAVNSFSAGSSGLRIGRELYVIAHQIGMLLAAEASAILFLVMYRLQKNYLFLAMSLIAGAFVFAANLASGLHVALSILPPVFTLGIGFRLEELIAEGIRRKQTIDEKYFAAMETWELASQEPENHPDWTSVLRAEVWAALDRKNDFGDIDLGERKKLADQEIKHHDWNRIEPQETEIFPFGSTALADPDSIVIMQNDNGRTDSGRKNGHHNFDITLK